MVVKAKCATENEQQGLSFRHPSWGALLLDNLPYPPASAIASFSLRARYLNERMLRERGGGEGRGAGHQVTVSKHTQRTRRVGPVETGVIPNTVSSHYAVCKRIQLWTSVLSLDSEGDMAIGVLEGSGLTAFLQAAGSTPRTRGADRPTAPSSSFAPTAPVCRAAPSSTADVPERWP